MNNPFETILNKLEAIETTVNTFISTNNKSSKENQQKSEDEYLDIVEASIFLKMPKSTLHFHKKYHDLPFIKPGKQLKFKKTDLIAWLESFSSTRHNNILPPIIENRKRYAK